MFEEKNVQQTAVASQSRSTELFISIFKYSKINLNKFFRFKLQMLDKIIIIFPLELFISIKLFVQSDIQDFKRSNIFPSHNAEIEIDSSISLECQARPSFG